MHPISSTQKENILSLASNGHSTHSIASNLGVSQPTVSRVLQDLLPNRQTLCTGLLSPISKDFEIFPILSASKHLYMKSIGPQDHVHIIFVKIGGPVLVLLRPTPPS